jgi:hypothetical protein
VIDPGRSFRAAWVRSEFVGLCPVVAKVWIVEVPAAGRARFARRASGLGCVWSLQSLPRMILVRTSFLVLLASILGCAASPEEDTQSAAGATGDRWFSIDTKPGERSVWETCEPSGGAASIGGGGAPAPEGGEGVKVRHCLGEKGVSFGLIAVLEEPPSEGGCLSLSCGAKKTVVVEVTKGADKMAGLGFAPLAKKALAKAACKDVPFAVTSAFEQMMGASDVHDFLSEQKIAAPRAGIGFAPGAGCGYRAVVLPADEKAAAALEKQGFQDVTK